MCACLHICVHGEYACGDVPEYVVYVYMYVWGGMWRGWMDGVCVHICV